MLTLRQYQADVIGRARGAYRDGARAPILCAPTGSGKGAMAGYIAAEAARRGTPTIFGVHRGELVAQLTDSLTAWEVPHGVISPQHPRTDALIQVASVQSLGGRLHALQRPGLIVWDECHHATAPTYRAVTDWAGPGCRLLGLTATPQRCDGKGLGDVFDCIIQGPSVAELQALGFLARTRYFAPPQVADLTGLRTRAGDYAREQAAQLMDSRAITGDAVEHYSRICPGQPAIAFCVSVLHAQHVAEQFRAAGYRAASIDGAMHPTVRARILNGLRDGSLDVLTSCDLVGEGLDVPGVAVVILLRPTQSLGLHIQQLGRALRPAPGKICATILDHVGNIGRHGFAETVHTWTLDGATTRAGKPKPPPVRTCPACYGAHPPAPACPYCGHVAPVQAREVEQVAGELREVTAETAQARLITGKARTMADLIALGKARGMRYPQQWAYHVMQARKRR